MEVVIDLLILVAVAAIAVLLGSLLTAIKIGFTEIIKGLEAIHEQLGKRPM